MKKNQPQYFSDHFNVDKAKLKELGVFDPILNFDTKVFVDPLLLKKSSNEIIRNSAKTFDDFFITLLSLVKISRQDSDKPWKEAQRRVKFPEYKYTCIGYGSDSINGSGSGAWLNDKILQSAKDIVDFAKDDPKIFLILPLLEEGIGADIISDMTQNIIDQHVCEFTIDIMQKLGLEANCKHKARNGVIYDLLVNPFITTKNNKNCPIKLLPNDILLDLPLADSFDEWLSEMADHNSNLRDSINKHLGAGFFEETKKKRKESLLDLLKNDKAFFMEVLEALKNHDFSHYDIEKDWKGLHRWLKDGEKFIKFKSSNKVGFLNDDLEEIFLAVGEIIDHFKYSIEKEELWRMFWTPQYSELAHVKEFYSQMLFYAVANSWVSSKDNNLNMIRSLNKETKLIDFKFYVSGKYAVNVQVKHSENYNGLKKGYDKKVKQKISRSKERDFYLVMNFDEDKSKQLKEIQKSPEEGFKIIEIDVADQENKQKDIFDFEPIEWELDNMFVEYKKSTNNPYSEGAKKRHEKTDIIKNNIIKQMFENKALIKGKTTQQRADKITEVISEAFSKKDDDDQPYSQEEINSRVVNFAKKYQIDLTILEESAYYFQDDKSEKIYKWCLEFNKQATS
jgi:hypothetical protein